jgi:4-carboxymuconolactone decarboxylase
MTQPSASAKDLQQRQEEARALSDNSDVGTFGRFVETPIKEMDADVRSAYDYTLKLRGAVPGPHKIWVSNPKLLRTIDRTGAYFQTESTLTKAEIEIATNVMCGCWRAAYSSYEHEKMGTEVAHLAPEKVAALIAGLPTSFDDARQQVVYELSSTLAAARVVPVSLLRRAQGLLGDAGIVDVTVLMGWFTMACLTLMTYDVPYDAVGLEQNE